MKGGCGSSFFLVLVRSFCLSFFPSSRPSPCVCPSVFAVSCLCLPFIMSSLSSLLWFPVSFIQCSLCLVFVFPFPVPLCLSLLLFPVSFLVFPVSCLCLPFCVSRFVFPFVFGFAPVLADRLQAFCFAEVTIVNCCFAGLVDGLLVWWFAKGKTKANRAD